MYSLILKGKIKTPIVIKKTTFKLFDCRVRIIRPRRRYFNKINATKPMFPYSFICYLGELELGYLTPSKSKAKQKLRKLLEINVIGRHTSEGMGRVQWISGSIRATNETRELRIRGNQIKIRKGLPHNLPEEVQKLIKYALVHDFVHTPKHRSKIYIEPELEDLEELRKHHDKTNDPFILKFQKYDNLSAIITRRIRSPKTNRYNWRAGNTTIDFFKLAEEIKEASKKSIGKLYEYIYQSKELGELNESLQHGHTSLRFHLLVLVNLIVRDYQRNNL
ncbi:MAG: hypothetical protein ACFFDI_06385 [Promethearchaeota archaeon]